MVQSWQRRPHSWQRPTTPRAHLWRNQLLRAQGGGEHRKGARGAIDQRCDLSRGCGKEARRVPDRGRALLSRFRVWGLDLEGRMPVESQAEGRAPEVSGLGFIILRFTPAFSIAYRSEVW